MDKLVHGIAVVIGFVLWRATGNIIIAAVVAVVAEGIILAISVAVARHKNTVAAAVAEGRIEPKRLWWRIVLIILFGFIALANVAAVIYGVIKDVNEAGLQVLPMAVIFTILLVLMILSLKKAKKWNTEIGNAKGD